MTTTPNVKYDKFKANIPQADQVVYRDVMKLRATDQLTPKNIQKTLD